MKGQRLSLHHPWLPFAAAFVMALLPFMVLAEDLGTFDYQTQVSIANSTTTALSNTPIAVIWQPDNLGDAGYMNTDGSDIRVADINGTQLSFTAQDVTSDDAVLWIVVASQAANSTAQYFIHTGSSTAVYDQGMYLSGSADYLTVTDAASLDVTTNLTLESELNLSTIPSDEAFLVRKADAYELGIKSSNTAFVRVYANANSDETLRPNASGTYTQLAKTGGCNPNYACVNEVVADDTEYVYENVTGPDPKQDSYGLGSSAIPSDSTINSVTVYYRGQEASGQATAQPILVLSGTSTTGTEQALTTSWAEYNSVVTRPGGGSWAVSDLADLEAGIILNSDATAEGRMSQLWVVVNYLPVYTASATGLTASTDQTVKGTYDGSNLRLYIDDAQVATTTASLTIASNSSNVVIGAGAGLTGLIDNTKIGDTSVASPTWKLTLAYQPAQIARVQLGTSANSWTWTGTVQDQSASNSDATYTFVRNMANITVWIMGLEIKALPDDVVTAATTKSVAGSTGITGSSEKAEASFFLRETVDPANVGDLGITDLAYWFLFWSLGGLVLGFLAWLVTRNNFFVAVAWMSAYYVGFLVGPLPVWVPIIATLVGLGATMGLPRRA